MVVGGDSPPACPWGEAVAAPAGCAQLLWVLGVRPLRGSSCGAGVLAVSDLALLGVLWGLHFLSSLCSNLLPPNTNVMEVVASGLL